MAQPAVGDRITDEQVNFSYSILTNSLGLPKIQTNTDALF